MANERQRAEKLKSAFQKLLEERREQDEQLAELGARFSFDLSSEPNQPTEYDGAAADAPAPGLRAMDLRGHVVRG